MKYPEGSPVHKNREKFNRPATHKDKKKEKKRGHDKHKEKINEYVYPL